MSMTLAAAILLAATTARPAAPSSDAPLPGPQAEAAILQIESETVAAYLKGDAEKLDRIWADEYGCFLPDGAVLAKADYLAGLRSGRIHYEVLEVESLTVQVFGDFAFASGRARVKGQDGSVTFDGLEGFLTVYSLRDGRWQAITTHRVAPPAGSESSAWSITLNNLNNDPRAVKDAKTVVKRASPKSDQGEDMLKGLSIVPKRVVSTALVVDADAAAPYLLPCDTPEEFCNIDEDIDCGNVSRAPGTGSSTRRRRR